MIRCAHCDAYMARGRNCSDLAVITLHWMSEHPTEYAARHPESGPYLDQETHRERHEDRHLRDHRPP